MNLVKAIGLFLCKIRISDEIELAADSRRINPCNTANIMWPAPINLPQHEVAAIWFMLSWFMLDTLQWSHNLDQSDFEYLITFDSSFQLAASTTSRRNDGHPLQIQHQNRPPPRGRSRDGIQRRGTNIRSPKTPSRHGFR